MILTKVYWLHTFDNLAKIGIMARPRGNDWLEDEIINLKLKKVEVLISLLERSEIDELKLELEPKLCSSKQIEFINFPIPDRDIPNNNDKINQLIDNLVLKIDRGNSIVIHCRMGIGRSSIIAAAILLKYGFRVEEIIDKISIVRGMKVPDTDQQLDWLRQRE